MANARTRIAELAMGLCEKPLLAATLKLAARVVRSDPRFVVAVLDTAIADNRGKSEYAHDLLAQAREIARGEV